MKKVLFIAVVATAFSFNATAQATFGFQVGANLASVKYEDGSGKSTENDPRIGAIAGFIADFPMGPLSFRPEINFIQKGFKNTSSESILGIDYKTEDKWRLNYVEVPLNFVFNIPMGTGKVFFGLGPNFGLGLSGDAKSKLDVGSNTSSKTVDVKFDGDKNANDDKIHLKRFDVGGNVLAGFQSDMGITLNIGYTLGLSDIAPNDNSNSTLKNRGLTLKLGYMFGGSKSKRSTSSRSSTSSNF